VLYHNNYWSNLFGQKYDPSVLEVFQPPKYFGNVIIFISHSIANSQKHWSLAVAALLPADGYAKPTYCLTLGLNMIFAQMLQQMFNMAMNMCELPLSCPVWNMPKHS
jgi:hypothetical protein